MLAPVNDFRMRTARTRYPLPLRAANGVQPFTPSLIRQRRLDIHSLHLQRLVRHWLTQSLSVNLRSPGSEGYLAVFELYQAMVAERSF